MSSAHIAERQTADVALERLVETERKRQIRESSDSLAPARSAWIDRNRFYYEDDRRYMRFLVGEGARVLEIGCGDAHLLSALRPARGVGVDISQRMVAEARARYPHLEFHAGDIEDPETIARLGGPFDAIVLSDVIGYLEDCQRTLEMLHPLCHSDTRLVIAYFSQIWRPILAMGERIGQKMPQRSQNWLSLEDVEAVLRLADFEPIKREWRQLLPKRLGRIGPMLNRTVGTLPVVRRLNLRHYVVSRPVRHVPPQRPSASVVIPCRNEAGNVESAILRMPRFCERMEIIFVEGHSQDATVAEIERVIDAYPEWTIRFAQQSGKGKGDAVRKGFEVATGDVLIILDADLTVAPEDLPKFYEVIASGKGDYAQGTRLVYPMAKGAMRRLNFLGNHAFARLFTWLLNQRITDTLCGTKAISRRHYEALSGQRDYFGDFDPYGDFDLIFGATKLNLKIVEVPVRYAERTYGTTQITRFRDGVLLLRMVAFAFKKLKAL